jgi:hypothetical protein
MATPEVEVIALQFLDRLFVPTLYIDVMVV